MAHHTVGPKPQLTLLLDHFASRRDISDVEARALFRIRALPRRISDLEERGHLFHRTRRVDSTGQRYVRYHYLGHADVTVAA